MSEKMYNQFKYRICLLRKHFYVRVIEHSLQRIDYAFYSMTVLLN